MYRESNEENTQGPCSETVWRASGHGCKGSSETENKEGNKYFNKIIPQSYKWLKTLKNVTCRGLLLGWLFFSLHQLERCGKNFTSFFKRHCRVNEA